MCKCSWLGLSSWGFTCLESRPHRRKWKAAAAPAEACAVGAALGKLLAGVLKGRIGAESPLLGFRLQGFNALRLQGFNALHYSYSIMRLSVCATLPLLGWHVCQLWVSFLCNIVHAVHC